MQQPEEREVQFHLVFQFVEQRRKQYLSYGYIELDEDKREI